MEENIYFTIPISGIENDSKIAFKTTDDTIHFTLPIHELMVYLLINPLFFRIYLLIIFFIFTGSDTIHPLLIVKIPFYGFLDTLFKLK